jgi:beta-glucosidase
LTTDAESIAGDGTVVVRFAVTNTGDRDGDEVAQLYARRAGPDATPTGDGGVDRPLQALVGFRRVAVPAGGTRAVELTLRASDLARWDPQRAGFGLDPGTVELRVGASSADIRLTKTLVAGP